MISKPQGSQGAEINSLPETPLSHRLFLQIVVLDVLLYASLFWREYDVPGQMLIAHYISFVAITDLGALFLPRARRAWFNLFRITSGVSLLVLVIALAAKGLDGEALMLTLLRVLLSGARIAHGFTLLRRHGPELGVFAQFPSHALAYFKAGNASERMGCLYLFVGLGLLYFPHLAYWTHFNAGEDRLNDVLTGLQAQAGLNFCIKLMVFEILVVSAGAKLAMRTTVATLFIIQWPWMPGMFLQAPIPLFHAVVELYELSLVIMGLRFLQRPSRGLPA